MEGSCRINAQNIPRVTSQRAHQGRGRRSGPPSCKERGPGEARSTAEKPRGVQPQACRVGPGAGTQLGSWPQGRAHGCWKSPGRLRGPTPPNMAPPHQTCGPCLCTACCRPGFPGPSSLGPLSAPSAWEKATSSDMPSPWHPLHLWSQMGSPSLHPDLRGLPSEAFSGPHWVVEGGLCSVLVHALLLGSAGIE